MHTGTAASTSINELEIFKQRDPQFETRNKEVEISLQEYQNKYFEI
jgi:hypothetical protein